MSVLDEEAAAKLSTVCVDSCESSQIANLSLRCTQELRQSRSRRVKEALKASVPDEEGPPPCSGAHGDIRGPNRFC